MYKVYGRPFAGSLIAEFLLNEANADYEFIKVDYESSKKDDFLKKSPMGKIPVLECFLKQDFEQEYQLGDTISVVLFEEGEFVDISGTSKGKGFQGVVKRHGFAGVGQATHGQHNRLRAPGSIGAASYPARVFKGMRMAGRMGGDKVKVQNLRVLKVVVDKNLLVVKGCVPGAKNAYVIVEK